MVKPTTANKNTRERIMIKMTVAEALEQLGNEHKGKRIEMANRCGYWWNYWNEEVAVIRTNNKNIFITVK